MRKGYLTARNTNILLFLLGSWTLKSKSFGSGPSTLQESNNYIYMLLENNNIFYKKKVFEISRNAMKLFFIASYLMIISWHPWYQWTSYLNLQKALLYSLQKFLGFKHLLVFCISSIIWNSNFEYLLI